MEFKAQIEETTAMLAFIEGQAKGVDISGERLQRIRLASEEALVNVVYHAFEERGAPTNKVNITCEFFEPNRFLVTIRDEGRPFDPTKQAVDLQENVPIEERASGGLGIHMMRELADEITYERIHDENHLILSFVKE